MEKLFPPQIAGKPASIARPGKTLNAHPCVTPAEAGAQGVKSPPAAGWAAGLGLDSRLRGMSCALWIPACATPARG